MYIHISFTSSSSNSTTSLTPLSCHGLSSLQFPQPTSDLYPRRLSERKINQYRDDILFLFVKRGFLTWNLYMSKQIYNENSSLFLKGNCMFNISAFVRLPENSVTAGKYICNRSLIQYFQRGQFPCKYEKKHAR